MAGRKKLGRSSFHARVAPETPERLKQLAEMCGYTYAGEGSTGAILDAIAEAFATGEVAKLKTTTVVTVKNFSENSL